MASAGRPFIEMFLRPFETFCPTILRSFSQIHPEGDIDMRSPQFYGAFIPH